MGLRDRVVRHFAHPAHVAPSVFQTNFHGHVYAGNLAQFIDWFVYFYGTYEKQELELMRDVLKLRAPAVCVDVGANVGHHTLFLSRWAAKCHSFEPYDVVRRQLTQKLEMNGITNVVVHDVGLGSADGFLKFTPPSDRNIGTGTFVSSGNEDGVALRVVNGDAYFVALGIEKLDLIKIDVEGFEKQTLVGLQDTLRRFRPHVFMEFSTSTRKAFSSVGELMSLFPAGYLVQSVRTNEPFLFLFNRVRYRLSKFDFDYAATNLLLSPEERPFNTLSN